MRVLRWLLCPWQCHETGRHRGADWMLSQAEAAPAAGVTARYRAFDSPSAR